MSETIAIITASDRDLRNRSLDSVCRGANLEKLLAECAALDEFRRSSDNLYERVRALFFLYAIHRFHIPAVAGSQSGAQIPFAGYTSLLKRRFQEALDSFLAAQAAGGPGASISSALAAGYRSLGFQTLADQVRRSVRSVRGNQWMFRTGHPSDHPLRIRPELLARPEGEVFPVLRETTPVRMDLTHSGWSDIFFLGMAGEAIHGLDSIMNHLMRGDIKAIGAGTHANFDGPIQTIIPWAGNLYTDLLIRQASASMGRDFWGFWMLGGMAGGGMGFLFSPQAKATAQDRMAAIMRQTRQRLQHAAPFAMEPVVYDFAINERGTEASLLSGDDALMPAAYYTLAVPGLLKADPRLLSAGRRAELTRFSDACRTAPRFSGMVQQLFDHMLPREGAENGNGKETLTQLLRDLGSDSVYHDRIQADLRAGHIGLAQNRLPVNTTIEDSDPGILYQPRGDSASRYAAIGREALAEGAVAVISLAGGVGSRWTKGAGVVKALNPFCRLAGKRRSFIELHLAKSRRTGRLYGALPPHVITTSYLTHSAIEEYLCAESNYGYPGLVLLSPGKNVGLRMIPMERDLRFAWEETPQQTLDEQAEKLRESLHATLIEWARRSGEGSDYTDNLPLQCLHPVGHWYELPNLLRNGVLARLLEERPKLRHLMVHNIDTAGADLDPEFLGYHIDQKVAMTTEVIQRHLEDRGGGLAEVDGRVRLVEGLALPGEDVESRLSFYNSATYWIDIDRFLRVFGLSRSDIANQPKITSAVRTLAARMPTYITLKDVKKRWGKGQEDVFPVAQFEKLWGDMTALPEWDCRYALVPRARGQQLKEPAQLDGWLRDGSAAYVESLCDWR